MFIFDLHCDTITTARERGEGLLGNNCQVSLERLESAEWCQCFAIWIDDSLRGQAAVDFYHRHLEYFAGQMKVNSNIVQQARTAMDIRAITGGGRAAAVLTVEGGAALGGRVEMLEQLAQDGVWVMTLTWNGENELAAGQLCQGGLTPLGREVVSRMEQLGIAADVSHLNETGFWELDRFAKRPFIATHSNCCGVWDCGRNLTDDQIKAIAQRGGIVGITIHSPFVDGSKDASFDSICRQLDHLLETGGEGCAALGTDYDGSDSMPAMWSGCQTLPGLYRELEKRFGTKVTAGIMGGNALEFFCRYQG